MSTIEDYPGPRIESKVEAKKPEPPRTPLETFVGGTLIGAVGMPLVCVEFIPTDIGLQEYITDMLLPQASFGAVLGAGMAAAIVAINKLRSGRQ